MLEYFLNEKSFFLYLLKKIKQWMSQTCAKVTLFDWKDLQ